MRRDVNLDLHHKQFRSHVGEDSEGNLIALCNKCHGGCSPTVVYRAFLVVDTSAVKS
jgi:HNH endonuclease